MKDSAVSTKVTARAGANIAFVKYWGAKDLDRAIPLNPSISMTLAECASRATVAFAHGSDAPDEIRFLPAERGEVPAGPAVARIRRHLDRLRQWAAVEGQLRVSADNTFPSAAGLASSASGFAALALAATRAMGRTTSPETLASLARLGGSGSAARSVLGGFVEWPAEATSPAKSALDGVGLEGSELGEALPVAITPPGEWDLRDVIAIVDREPKAVSSREGHRRAPTSAFFRQRLQNLTQRLSTVRRAILERDLESMGTVLEEEAVELHLIAMSSRPPVFYWKPGTLGVLAAVRELRRGGSCAYATMDAGANVHVICSREAEGHVARRLGELPEVLSIIRDRVGAGPTLEAQHLF